MRILSTGQPATLGTYLKLTNIFFGEDGPASKFIQKKIAESPDGENEEVIAAESQMLYLLGSIQNGKV